MPPRGYSSITVPEELYRDVKRFFQKEKKFFMRRGIRSLAAWITVTLYKEMREHVSMKNVLRDPNIFAERLKTIFSEEGAEIILKHILKNLEKTSEKP